MYTYPIKIKRKNARENAMDVGAVNEETPREEIDEWTPF